jgi:pimeloyl-ACP methyl ester carboxylesterase
VRIHGTRDRLLPAGQALIDYPVPGAGHFLIVSHAKLLSQLLSDLADKALS